MFRTDDFKSTLCRLSYAGGLYKARAVIEGGAKRYGCTLIFPKADRPALEKHVRDCILGEWSEKGLERAKAGLIKSPFLAGDGKEARNKQTGEIHPGLGPDVFFIRPSATEDRPPHVRWKDINKQETETTVYSGCYGTALLNCFAWHNDKSGDGVSFGIQMFQRFCGVTSKSFGALPAGESLGGTGSVDVEKYYETIEDAGSAPESTKGGDGASALFG
jgi:hypothetical protein